VFSGESMFPGSVHGRDASKTALIRLVLELGESSHAPTVDQESCRDATSHTLSEPSASGESTSAAQAAPPRRPAAAWRGASSSRWARTARSSI